MMSREPIETRAKILNAAWSRLESAAGTEVRMSDIAKAAGVSRQAVYLHFPTRAALLIATTRHIDDVKDVAARLAPSRAATTGRERLAAFIEAWCHYIPEIDAVARALIQMAPTDAAAREAWDDRLAAIHDGCMAATKALARDGALSDAFTVEEAADLLAALVSVDGYDALVHRAGWPQAQYVAHMKTAAARLLIG